VTKREMKHAPCSLSSETSSVTIVCGFTSVPHFHNTHLAVIVARHRPCRPE